VRLGYILTLTGGKRYRVVVGQYIENQTDIEIFEKPTTTDT